MYKVTIIKKEESFNKISLKYETTMEAVELIENVFAGDLDNIYECKIEIVDEENGNGVD